MPNFIYITQCYTLARTMPNFIYITQDLILARTMPNFFYITQKIKLFVSLGVQPSLKATPEGVRTKTVRPI
jgi:hypothetical protein